MNIRFADTMTAEYQDRVCSILASLCLMSDAQKRMGDCNGNLRWLYQREVRYHYKRAMLDVLRLLGILIHDTSIASNTNLDRLCKNGHAALEDLINKNLYCFDTEAE